MATPFHRVLRKDPLWSALHALLTEFEYDPLEVLFSPDLENTAQRLNKLGADKQLSTDRPILGFRRLGHTGDVRLDFWHPDQPSPATWILPPSWNGFCVSADKCKLSAACLSAWLDRRQEQLSATARPKRMGSGFAMKRGDREILQALADAFPETMTVEQIEGAIQRSPNRLAERAIRERLKALRKAKLVEQPRGPRGGHSITEDGNALLDGCAG